MFDFIIYYACMHISKEETAQCCYLKKQISLRKPILYIISNWAKFELTTSEVIGTDSLHFKMSITINTNDKI
jgi:hypothetical protein